ncbi:endonuclease III domain-containing protein [Brevibacillus sp. H7]|uniref:endonuclease III domain-containing protein n=1 Tax=Brevibacillus sp. H7 TaxID=3349138 RepID=UPI0037FD0003
MWRRIYEGLQAHFPAFSVDDWWGVTDSFARMAGSILVQNTAWTHAKRALEELERAGLLEPEALTHAAPDYVANLIRPAGFQQAKSAALIRLSQWVLEKGGLDALLSGTESADELRQELLQIKGIGPETADTILAYALKRPAISGDAYSRRLYERLTGESLSYEQIRRAMLNEFHQVEELQRLHGLVVEHGKEICQKRNPRCGICLFASHCNRLSCDPYSFI